MNGRLERLFESLTAMVAVATLPLGILAAIFLGLPEAAAVFVVGWLLLVPVFGILSNVGSDPEEIERWMDVAERAKAMSREDGAAAEEKPLEALRERYARGEIDDAEFEARVERLVATEEIPPGAVDRVDSASGPTGTRDDGRAPASTGEATTEEPQRGSTGGEGETERLRER